VEISFIFIFGLIIGSFLNVVICRLAEGGSLVFDRSRCPKCAHTLSWYELVPVASFIIQRARCRACKEKISWQYPLVELAAASLFVFIYNFLPAHYYGWEMIYLFAVWAALLVIFVFDLKHYIIPNKVLYPLILIVGAHAFFNKGFLVVPHALLSALGGAGFFLALYLISRGKWIGFGDVKFGVFMGLFLGFPLIVVAFFFSYLVGAIIGSILLLRHIKGLRSEVPFGPFLVLGTFIAYFYGNSIIQWYLNIF
jgi:prepilin signal peptidase PulO-like enzyme (type II secretory pathway)